MVPAARTPRCASDNAARAPVADLPHSRDTPVDVDRDSDQTQQRHQGPTTATSGVLILQTLIVVALFFGAGFVALNLSAPLRVAIVAALSFATGLVWSWTTTVIAVRLRTCCLAIALGLLTVTIGDHSNDEVSRDSRPSLVSPGRRESTPAPPLEKRSSPRRGKDAQRRDKADAAPAPSRRVVVTRVDADSDSKLLPVEGGVLKIRETVTITPEATQDEVIAAVTEYYLQLIRDRRGAKHVRAWLWAFEDLALKPGGAWRMMIASDHADPTGRTYRLSFRHQPGPRPSRDDLLLYAEALRDSGMDETLHEQQVAGRAGISTQDLQARVDSVFRWIHGGGIRRFVCKASRCSAEPK